VLARALQNGQKPTIYWYGLGFITTATATSGPRSGLPRVQEKGNGPLLDLEDRPLADQTGYRDRPGQPAESDQELQDREARSRAEAADADRDKAREKAAQAALEERARREQARQRQDVIAMTAGSGSSTTRSPTRRKPASRMWR